LRNPIIGIAVCCARALKVPVRGPADDAAALKEAEDARFNAHILSTGGYWNAVRGGWR